MTDSKRCHYAIQQDGDLIRPACSKIPDRQEWKVTTNLLRVTCMNCRNTPIYKQRVGK